MSNNIAIWLPHLILQRGLQVKDLTQVNFTANLVEHTLGERPKMWQPKENKPNMQEVTQALDLNDPRVDNKRGQFFDRGARPNHLIEEHVVSYDKKTQTALVESIKLRGESVYFNLLGYNTFLFQTEYDLIKDIVDKIEEITIQVTYGLSPLFKVLAKLREE